MLTQDCQMVIILLSFNTANKVFRNYLDMHTHTCTYTHTNKSIPIVGPMPLFFFSYHLSFLIIINMPLILIFFLLSRITVQLVVSNFLLLFFLAMVHFFFPNEILQRKQMENFSWALFPSSTALHLSFVEKPGF